jgi:hypothetical protein
MVKEKVRSDEWELFAVDVLWAIFSLAGCSAG